MVGLSASTRNFSQKTLIFLIVLLFYENVGDYKRIKLDATKCPGGTF